MSIKQTILLIVGSRPEAIKMAPIARALRALPRRYAVTLCSTGQQRDLIPQALAEFGLAADLDLQAMQPGQSLSELFARLMARLDPAIARLRPDWMLVQGDTTSALAGALAGFYRRVPVAHVEAGMRSGDPLSPYPEEVNRRAISQCAALHFAATPGCRANLLREGIGEARIVVTGNTVVDALLWVREQLRGQRPSAALLPCQEGRRLLLVTSHRRENFGPGLERICQALRELVRRVDDTVIVYPLHPNPNVLSHARRILGDTPRVLLVPPQPYRTLLDLIDRSYMVLTDSGGLQEEAPTFGKPLLVLRETTERPEGVAAGIAELVGTDPDHILRSALALLNDPQHYARMAGAHNPYGDGQAAGRIVAALSEVQPYA